mgnify:CR=1 FL=1
MVKIQNIGVKLDDFGDLDLKDVATENEKNYILKNEAIVKLTLM